MTDASKEQRDRVNATLCRISAELNLLVACAPVSEKWRSVARVMISGAIGRIKSFYQSDWTEDL